jgi:hypothetical protein
MNPLTNFAGPLGPLPCVLPTEKSGFMIVFVVAALFLLVGLINLKLYSTVLRTWFAKSALVFWKSALLLCFGILTFSVTIGYFTGKSDEISGYTGSDACGGGVWEGLQIPLMRVALITTAFILILAIILGLLFIIKLLIAAYKKAKNKVRGGIV